MSTTSPGARANPAVARGSKINLRPPDPELKARLEGLGYKVSTIGAQGCDLVLVAPGSTDEQRSVAQQRAKAANIPVMEATELLAQLELLAAAGTAPVVELPRREAVEITDTHVRILDVTLPRRNLQDPRVPPPQSFRHLCFDEALLKAARTVAQAALHGVPAVLEGETATAKTTAILWVAHLIGQPVVRLNLNGQTDTSELVGRYVPAGDFGEWNLSEMSHHSDILEAETRLVIERAMEEKRPLSWVERVAIAANERMPVVSWRFQEGTIPQAMRHGWWVILDEMNLAEPQVLERLNPVLEVPATMVLSEGSGTSFGPRGDVHVDPHFRLFGTMNPAEYAGRSALSPAFRDRWSIWTFVRTPDDAALRAMLRCLVHGDQPEVVHKGIAWQGRRAEAVYPSLVEVPGIEDLLDRLAMFHCSVNRAAGNGEAGATIGRTRRERYIFTRRTLLATMRMFATELRMLEPSELAERARGVLEDVIDRVYVTRIQDDADRAAILTSLRAAGLGG
jgi:MoxR-like ATPase